MEIKLLKIIYIEGLIELKSGLHIGSGNEEIKIGGTDQPVIKNPVTGYPYIPGSSLKGKIRSLLEWSEGKTSNGGPYHTSDSEDNIARVFGNGKNDKDYLGGPTRVSFNDCNINHDFLKELELKKGKGAFFEIKTEVSIDRVKGTASGAGPRQIERVVAGARFDFSLSYKVFSMGSDDSGGSIDLGNFEFLLKGLRMLELDSLGGSASRGYGKIEFMNLKSVDDDIMKDIDLKKIDINK